MLSRGAVVLGALMLPSTAMACSCMRIAPEAYRRQADVIIVGRVTHVSGGGGMVAARIRVSQRIKGHPPRTVTVRSPDDSAACGYRFTVGEAREFLLSRHEAVYKTNICLMMGARR